MAWHRSHFAFLLTIYTGNANIWRIADESGIKCVQPRQKHSKSLLAGSTTSICRAEQHYRALAFRRLWTSDDFAADYGYCRLRRYDAQRITPDRPAISRIRLIETADISPVWVWRKYLRFLSLAGSRYAYFPPHLFGSWPVAFTLKESTPILMALRS